MTAPDATAAVDVAVLRGLLDAATPVGEWSAVEGDLEGKPASEYARTLFANRESDGTTMGRLFLTVAPNPIDPEKGATVVPALTGDGPQSEANAHLIAAAVNNLPAFLALAEQHAALVEAVRAIAHSEQADKFRDEACRGTVALPYASNRYVRLLDDLRAALSAATEGGDR